MVRALLSGAKTQTRRIVKPPRDTGEFVLVETTSGGWWPYKSDDGESNNVDGMEIPLKCPYGKPGDRLWMRESFGTRYDLQGPLYKADMDNCGQCPVMIDGERVWVTPKEPWKPSIHMPRMFSRITLEITSVRVERLQGISEEDALAEGVKPGDESRHQFKTAHGKHRRFMVGTAMTAKVAYQSLWNSINGPGSWDANPWVWVIEFKQIEAAGAAAGCHPA